MKTFVITARRAAFGWPFYVTQNLAAYTQEQAEPSAKLRVAFCGALLIMITSAIWAAGWLLVVRILWQAVGTG
jgi:hypothetical protein